jgi:DNA-binding response OmpR family regulator
MPVGVCLIRAGLPAPDALGELLGKCGLSVWTPAAPDADDGHIYGGALCIVIDMPREAGFRTLKLFRDYGVETPILLIVDPGLEKATAGAEWLWGIDVVPRDVEPRDILRRIEALFLRRHRSETAGRLRA